jgi:hypothetical protein
MAEYPLTARERLRTKRHKAFTDAQDRLTGFAAYARTSYYDGSDNEIVVNGEEYHVRLAYDANNPSSDLDMYEVVSKDRLPSDVDRGDWCDDPSPGHRHSNEVLVLSEDMRVQQRADYYRKVMKYGKAAAWDCAVLHRNASLEYAKKLQKGNVAFYGVVVTNEEGQIESLWGVDEEGIIDTIRDLVSQF